ncbi:MAG: hypothetical protein U9N35_05525 [Euryarchaeota archaeon]|nr:hypothetical protein [Euryarchaeota archaeon]
MYEVEEIYPDRKDELIEEFKDKILYERKADLTGMCIKLLTDNHTFKDMWGDNFSHMLEYIRPHGRVFALNDGGDLKVFYEPRSKTCFIFNSKYYGYVKSLALAVAGDFLEEYHSIHSRYSVHGAAIDYKGDGISMIAPSGAGKTTHSYGLLLLKGTKLVADDWYYTQILGDSVLARASEKNCYIRKDIASIYPEFRKLVKDVDLDLRDRAVVDISRVIGKTGTKNETRMEKVIFLKRDDSEELCYEMDWEEALNYMTKNDFCNPHQLVRNERKMRIRKEFFETYFQMVDLYMVNTRTPPKETQKNIRKIVTS